MTVMKIIERELKDVEVKCKGLGEIVSESQRVTYWSSPLRL